MFAPRLIQEISVSFSAFKIGRKENNDRDDRSKKTKENQDDKETVLMSFVNSIKKVRENKPEEIEIPKTDLPRPDVPRDIEEPTLMDALKNTENEEDES